MDSEHQRTNDLIKAICVGICGQPYHCQCLTPICYNRKYNSVFIIRISVNLELKVSACFTSSWSTCRDWSISSPITIIFFFLALRNSPNLSLVSFTRFIRSCSSVVDLTNKVTSSAYLRFEIIRPTTETWLSKSSRVLFSWCILYTCCANRSSLVVQYWDRISLMIFV